MLKRPLVEGYETQELDHKCSLEIKSCSDAAICWHSPLNEQQLPDMVGMNTQVGWIHAFLLFTHKKFWSWKNEYRYLVGSYLQIWTMCVHSEVTSSQRHRLSTLGSFIFLKEETTQSSEVKEVKGKRFTTTAANQSEELQEEIIQVSDSLHSNTEYKQYAVEQILTVCSEHNCKTHFSANKTSSCYLDVLRVTNKLR